MSSMAYQHWDKSYLPVDPAGIPSPALLFYEDRILDNIRKAVEIAGSPHRLRPHVKTYKTREIVQAQIAAGITKFKCATIAEADMLGAAGAADVLLAYPLVGPNIGRLVELTRLYPKTTYSVVFDDETMLEMLSAAAVSAGISLGVYLDLDAGMHRTGVSAVRAPELYRRALSLPGIRVDGIHCYDGQNHQVALQERQEAGSKCFRDLSALIATLKAASMPVQRVVLGGTPTFGIYAALDDVELSPGTGYLQDWGYMSKYPDLDFKPAALVLTRVISINRDEKSFTLDLGSKAIATDPPGVRGVLYDRGPDFAEPLFQSEEHWVFRLNGSQNMPAIGETMLVLPTHICPTVNLHDRAQVIGADGKQKAVWDIIARGRVLRV